MTTFQSRIATAGIAIAVSINVATACAAQVETGPYESPIVFDAGGRPSATVRLNDTADFLFAIDTAAQNSTLGQDIVRALQLQAAPDQRAQVHGTAGVTTLPMYPLTSLEFAGRRVEGGLYISPVEAHDNSQIGHAGIVGQDLFATGEIVFDFVNNTVAFGDGITIGRGPSISADVVYGGFFLVDVTVNGMAATALIDTGARESFANPAMMAALGVSADDADISAETEIMGVGQNRAQRLVGYQATVRIAGAERLAPLVFIDSPAFRSFNLTDQPALVMGMDVLSQLQGFGLDYEGSTFFLVEG